MASNHSPDPLFQQLLERIRFRSDRIARYVAGDSMPRRWMTPPLNGWDGNPFSITDIKLPFDRDTLNTDTENYYTDATEGTSGLTGGRVLQIVYMAVMERAFRARHMSPIRAMMHAAGRRKGHGHVDGIHTGDILNYIQDVLGSGG
jgi:hypothetical protein